MNMNGSRGTVQYNSPTVCIHVDYHISCGECIQKSIITCTCTYIHVPSHVTKYVLTCMWIERKGKREVTKLYPNQGTLLFHFAVLPQLQLFFPIAQLPGGSLFGVSPC